MMAETSINNNNNNNNNNNIDTVAVATNANNGTMIVDDSNCMNCNTQG